MNEQKYTTIITYRCPAVFRDARGIASIYEVVDGILNHPPKEYTEVCIIGSSPDKWDLRVDLDESRTRKLIETFVDKFVDAMDIGLLEIKSDELPTSEEHSDESEPIRAENEQDSEV